MTPEEHRIAALDHFAAVKQQFHDAKLSASIGKYQADASFWLPSCALRPERAKNLLDLLQNDGWLLSSVRWEWFEAAFGMRGASFVKHRIPNA